MLRTSQPKWSSLLASVKLTVDATQMQIGFFFFAASMNQVLLLLSRYLHWARGLLID